MALSPLAGKPAPAGLLIDPARLEREYYERRPDVDDTDQLVSFGTSGHRGTPARGTFTESHILAIAQAICDYRRGKGIDGPLYMGKDTHCLSAPAQRTEQVLGLDDRVIGAEAGDLGLDVLAIGRVGGGDCLPVDLEVAALAVAPLQL